MTETRLCPTCGAPLPAGSDDCPRCLLRLGLQLPTRDPSGPPSEAAPGAGAAPPRPVALPIEEVARRFPQLEILGLVGQGGMGVVYRARQPRLDRVVALKILPPELTADGNFAERFLREARAMARLSHPHIVAVHDFGESEGLCWLIMEYVDGVNLREALRAGTLSPEKALALVPQMCEALQYAHDEGVVHRDIKPENVLLDRQGRVRIADFGLAKLAGRGDVTLTSERQVFGTPHYMAPEQMEAARDVDHRADIFSLGVVFYEMLTGRLPLGRFEPPSRRVHVDVRVDEIVLHALEHEPERRYQHAVDVKTDVESVAHGGEPRAARADGGGAGAGGGTGGGPPGVGAAQPAAAGPAQHGRATAAGAAVRLLIGFALADLATVMAFSQHNMEDPAAVLAVFGAWLLWTGTGRLFEAEGADALGDPQALGAELLAWMAAGVGALGVAGGLLAQFSSPPAELAAQAGALLGIEAVAVWLLRRWARKHPARGRALAAPFERRAQLRRDELAAREARHARRGKGEPRILAGFVFGRHPRPVGAGPETSGAESAAGVSAPASDPLVKTVRPAPSLGRRLGITGIGVAMVIWPAAAWIFAGMLASSGWDGVAAGAALMAVTAWWFVQILVHSSPTLRDALRDEPVLLRVLRQMVAWPLVVAGVLLLGATVVERWERGTQHYVSPSRSPAALFDGDRNEVADALARLPSGMLEGFDRDAQSNYYSTGPMPPMPEESGAMGVMCLLGFALASTLRFPGLAGWDTCWRPVVLAPLLLLVGLRLAGAWNGLEHEGEEFPARVPVAGEQSFDMSAERARSALRTVLATTGLHEHAEQTARLMTPGGGALGTEYMVALESEDAWDRWDLVDGAPRRRQPHVVLRVVGRGDQCVVLWNCGEVSPLDSEPLLWRTWMERILGEAGGF
ncbi:MAG TPA: serine/threonine-protein kinase [Planctomycetota bacterium]|nr:serine/threonine-protein kinase [Planctomycetota bacterium]